MKMFLLSLFCASSVLATSSEFPEVIDFRNFTYFQENLLYNEKDSWTWSLGNSAFKLGLTSFNDSPEIGTFFALLKKDYHLDAAVETGTFLGATTQYFSLHYNEVHTIETSIPLYDAAKARFQDQPNIHCHFGDSKQVLKTILPSLQGKRVLFYLDAHGGDIDGCPILQELEDISKTHRDNCVIVVDDFKVPDTNIHGAIYNNIELSYEYIQSQLNKVFSDYSFYYILPRQISRSAKFVAVPQKWEKEVAWNKKRVDILSGFSIYDFPIKLDNVSEAGYKIQMRYQYPYGSHYSPYDPDLKRIIMFGGTLDWETLKSLPREKLVFCIMEPYEMPAGYYDYFPRVYTCNDDLVDGVKFFKLNYPYLAPMRTQLPSFEEKKLCVMVSGSDNEYPERKNELYSERMKMVEFFETKPPGDFDIYGRYWVKRKYRDFRGSIPGDHSGEEKLAVLSKYRFCICFENTKDMPGYISEKIFNCFTAGCVPVYWGANNIDTYIPSDCFIDYRDFADREELYRYLKSMAKSVYEEYLSNIRAFLGSKQGQLFSPAHFEKTIFEAITQ